MWGGMHAIVVVCMRLTCRAGEVSVMTCGRLRVLTERDAVRCFFPTTLIPANLIADLQSSATSWQTEQATVTRAQLPHTPLAP